MAGLLTFVVKRLVASAVPVDGIVHVDGGPSLAGRASLASRPSQKQQHTRDWGVRDVNSQRGGEGRDFVERTTD